MDLCIEYTTLAAPGNIFMTVLIAAKRILDNNQYPTNFYEPIISDIINRILTQQESENSTTKSNEKEEAPSHLVFLQYRGKPCEDYVQSLRRLGAPCKVVLTLQKLKTVLPSLKVDAEKCLPSPVVYNLSRFKQHLQPSELFDKHIRLCGVNPSFENNNKVSVLQSTSNTLRSEINAMPKLTRFKLTRDLINANSSILNCFY